MGWDNRQNNGYKGNDRQNNQQREYKPKFLKPIGNFFDKNGIVNLDWVGVTIKDFADYLGNTCEFTSNQMRNFYNEFLRIKGLPVSNTEKLILIKMLKAKVNYKQSSVRVPFEFKDFIFALVDEIGSDDLFLKRFDNACLIMEALVAFNPNTKKK